MFCRSWYLSFKKYKVRNKKQTRKKLKAHDGNIYLHGSHTMYPFPGQSSGLIMSHSFGLHTHLSAKALTSSTNKKYINNFTSVSKFDMLLNLLLMIRSFDGIKSIFIYILLISLRLTEETKNFCVDHYYGYSWYCHTDW